MVEFKPTYYNGVRELEGARKFEDLGYSLRRGTFDQSRDRELRPNFNKSQPDDNAWGELGSKRLINDTTCSTTRKDYPFTSRNN